MIKNIINRNQTSFAMNSKCHCINSKFYIISTSGVIFLTQSLKSFSTIIPNEDGSDVNVINGVMAKTPILVHSVASAINNVSHVVASDNIDFNRSMRYDVTVDNSFLDVDGTVLPYVNDMADNAELATSQFDHYREFYAKSVPISSTLDHFSDKEISSVYHSYTSNARLIPDIWIDTYKKVFSNSSDLIPDISPISSEKIDSIERTLAFSNKVQQSNIFHAAPESSNLKSSFVYGLAHGCRELLYVNGHSQVDESMTFEIKQDMVILPNQSSHRVSNNIIIIKHQRGTGTPEVRTVLVGQEHPIANVTSGIGDYSQSSCAMSESAERHFRDVVCGYSVYTDRVEVSRMVNHEVQNTAIAISDKNGFTAHKGVKLSTTTPFNSNHLLNNRSIISMMIAIFDLPRSGMSYQDEENYYTYLQSVIVCFIKNAIRYDSTNDIIKIDLSITVKRPAKTLDSLLGYFRNAVDSGEWYPTSTLQWALYHGKTDISAWDQYITCVNLYNPVLNAGLSGVAPTSSVANRYVFKSYARNHSKLCSSHLFTTTNFEIPYYRVDWKEFCYELFIRSLFSDEIPNCIPLFTRGDIKFGARKFERIELPTANPILSVFDEYDMDARIMKLVQFSLFMNKEWRHDRPKGFRAKSRLFDHIPTKFIKRFVRPMSTTTQPGMEVYKLYEPLWDPNMRSLDRIVSDGDTKIEPLLLLKYYDEIIIVNDALMSLCYMDRCELWWSFGPPSLKVEDKILKSSKHHGCFYINGHDIIHCIKTHKSNIEIISNGIYLVIKINLNGLMNYSEGAKRCMRVITTPKSLSSLMVKYNHSLRHHLL